MKSMLRRLLAWVVLGGMVCGVCLAQGEQRTTVVKSATDNPTVGVISFEGSPEAKAKLENTLKRCGWFRLVSGNEAANAAVRIQARCVEGNEVQVDTQVTTRSRVFQTNQKRPQLANAVYETVDQILRELFKVQGLCAQKIVFVMPGKDNLKELFTCYLDGTGFERLTHNSAISTEPCWGHKNTLVYTLAKDNALSIVLVDMANGRQRIISRARGLNASAALSHDGGKVALAMSVDNRVDLHVIDLQTNEKTALTSDKDVESSPTWSPDGKSICYVSDKLGAPNLFVIPAEGGQPRRLQLGGNECVSPDWSAQTNKLCYATRSNTGQYVIGVVDMGTPNAAPEIVTLASGDWEAPSWAPDGRHLVCTRRTGNKRDLYLVDTWLSAFSPITNGAPVSLPAWTPAF